MSRSLVVKSMQQRGTTLILDTRSIVVIGVLNTPLAILVSLAS